MHQGRADSQLEQYFDLIVFAAYVAEEEAGSTGVSFSAWLQVSWCLHSNGLRFNAPNELDRADIQATPRNLEVCHNSHVYALKPYLQRASG